MKSETIYRIAMFIVIVFVVVFVVIKAVDKYIISDLQESEECSYSFWIIQDNKFTHLVINKNGFYLDGVKQEEYGLWNRTKEEDSAKLESWAEVNNISLNKSKEGKNK